MTWSTKWLVPRLSEKYATPQTYPPIGNSQINEVYSDQEWQRIIAATCSVLEISQEQAEEAYADYFGRDSFNRWPMWFQMSANAREFLLRQPKIHNGFASAGLAPDERDAINDKFTVEERDSGLEVHYRSPNKLCGLYMALARWVLRHYGEDAVVSEHTCQKDGAEECTIQVSWA